ncbi:hypothetical protein [Streptomyces olivaceiscleroticus]|uniref:Plasmid stabilization protein n=1 Tax=Streptomyces olivaceiscleroticus TaxID=68245 RepID=A0ABP3LJ56_9ACTN
MYELRYDPTVEAVWDSLPETARDELDRAILAACQDPQAATEPYGEDDGVMRSLVLPHVMAVLLVNHAPRQTVRILQISYLV